MTDADGAAIMGGASIALFVFAIALFVFAIVFVALVAWADGADGAEKPLPHARKCIWCDTWMSEQDRWLHEDGALITHGLCESCERKHFGGEADA